MMFGAHRNGVMKTNTEVPDMWSIITGHTEVILRSLTTISNGKSASRQQYNGHC
jgi:hypothetical protein